MPQQINSDRFVFIDLETFGLVPEDDPVVEIGLMITDRNLIPKVRFSTLIWDAECEERLEDEREDDSFVYKMHKKSGLWDQADKYGISRDKANMELMTFLNDYGIDQGDAMCGSSVQFDREFLYHWCTDAAEKFSYRNIDVSTIKELCARFNPAIANRVEEVTKPRKMHRVMPDLDDTIRELKFYANEFLIVDENEVGPELWAY